MTYAACAVVVDPRGSVLALQRPDGFVLPGGSIQAGESPLRAAARETHEETGLSVQLHPAPVYVTRSTVFYRAVAFHGTLRRSVEGTPVWTPWPYLFAHPRHGLTAQRVAQRLGVRT